MKRVTKYGSVILVILLAVLLTACGSDAKTETSKEGKEQEKPDSVQTTEQTMEQTTEQEDAPVPSSTDAKESSLVIYFSRTGEQYHVGVIEKGNTAIVAEMIIEETGADSFEILPEDDYYPYTYEELTDLAKKEQNEKTRPVYAGETPDLSAYTTIYIGSPVWWGDWPMILYTFFEENAEALAGKTLIPFSTHGGSGLAGFDKKLASACPDSTIGTGLAISGTDAQNNPDKVRDAVKEWLAAA